MRRTVTCFAVGVSLAGCAGSGTGHNRSTDSRVTAKVVGTGSSRTFIIDWPPCDKFDVSECGEALKVTGLNASEYGCVEKGMDEHYYNGDKPVTDAQDAAAKATIWSIGAGLGLTLTPPVTYGVVPPGGGQTLPQVNGQPVAPPPGVVDTVLKECGAFLVLMSYQKPDGVDGAIKLFVNP